MELTIPYWDKTTSPYESELRQIYRQEGLVPYAWSNDPVYTYSPHSHLHHKVLSVVHGSITWVLPETSQEIKTGSGNRIDIIHAVLVGPHGVTRLEAQLD